MGIHRMGATGLILVVAVVSPLAAQDSPWSVEGEVGGALFFGNTDQTTLNTRAAMERSDSIVEFTTAAGFTYGRASDDEGVSSVNKRSWEVGGDVDYQPYGRISPFVFGKVESILERRIDLRVDGGIGGKLTLARTPESRIDLSLALLAEHTLPRAEAGEEVEVVTLARWSARFRFRRSLGEDRITFDSVSNYRPGFQEMDNFTAQTRNSLSFRMTDVVQLRITFVNDYDSEAVLRGADSNNDGQLFFSVLSSF